MTEGTRTKYDTTFFERYARISLIDLVDGRFESLQNYDRPDLQDKDHGVGIEVTRAIRENKDVAHALINEIAGRPVMDVSEEDWKDMTKYGYGYGINGEIIGRTEYSYWAAALPLQRVIESKVRKVSEGFYGDFREFGLYVFSKENLTGVAVSDAIHYTMALQKGNAKKYSVLYLSQIEELFVCDLAKASFDDIRISKAQRRKFYNEAIETKNATPKGGL